MNGSMGPWVHGSMGVDVNVVNTDDVKNSSGGIRPPSVPLLASLVVLPTPRALPPLRTFRCVQVTAHAVF